MTQEQEERVITFIEDTFLKLSFEQAKRKTKHGKYITEQARKLLHELKPKEYSSRDQTSNR